MCRLSKPMIRVWSFLRLPGSNCAKAIRDMRSPPKTAWGFRLETDASCSPESSSISVLTTLVVPMSTPRPNFIPAVSPRSTATTRSLPRPPAGANVVPATNFTLQEVHRPRPPHVAVISMDAACADFRIEVLGGRASVRRGVGSRGSVRMVRRTAMLPHSSGMLPPMEIRLETLKSLSQLAGFDWSDAELEAIRPAVARMLDLLARLETLPLASVEPTTQYRVL